MRYITIIYVFIYSRFVLLCIIRHILFLNILLNWEKYYLKRHTQSMMKILSLKINGNMGAQTCKNAHLSRIILSFPLDYFLCILLHIFTQKAQCNGNIELETFQPYLK